MIDIDRYMSFLEKHNLNQQQFLLVFCLHRKRYDIIERYKKMFPSEDGSAIGTILLNDLITKGFIEKVPGGGKGTSGYKVTSKFTYIFTDPREAAEEFWNLYPAFSISGNTRYPLTAMDEDAFRELYNRKINQSAEEHQEVMKDLEYAVKNNMINVTIKNFVGSRMWLPIRVERLRTNTIISTGEGRKKL